MHNFIFTLAIAAQSMYTQGVTEVTNEINRLNDVISQLRMAKHTAEVSATIDSHRNLFHG